MSRTILHLDLDAFYCSVEERRDPTLRGKAFAVGGDAGGRGVVSSCSYEARRFGVHSAMPMGQARGLCPHLICLPTHFPVYRAASAQVMALLHDVTPCVEQISIDEAFLDVMGLGETGAVIAGRLQAQVREALGLSCSLGIASNKLVAKIATDVGKGRVRSGASPRALCKVPSGTESEFLAPLPASALWRVGPKMAERLSELGIETIGDIALWPADDLRRRFGKYGDLLSRHCLGLDEREVVTERETKSVSRETTFSRDVRDEAALRAELTAQAGEVCGQLRREGLCAGTVKLKLEATGLRLGSPASQTGDDVRPNGWLARFMANAKTRGLRVDFVCIHPYQSSMDPVQAAKDLRAEIEYVRKAYGLPIWVTEYGLVNWGTNTYPDAGAAAKFAVLSAALMDRLPYVERYAWYSLIPGQGTLSLTNADGSLNSIGAAWAGAAGGSARP